MHTPGFVDNVKLLYYGTGGPESSTTLCFEEVRLVAVPVVYVRQLQCLVAVHHSEALCTGGEVCRRRLICYS